MQIDYDPQADAIYVRLRSGEVDDTLSVGKYIYVDWTRMVCRWGWKFCLLVES